VLPYVQPPAAATRRIGNEHSGIIEMGIRGGLTVTESRMISAMLAEHESALVASAKLADAIATAENITITEAFDIVQAAVRGAELETIMLRHASDIARIANLLQSSNDLPDEATVTTLIRTRCNRPDWSHADTLGLDGAIFRGILDFAAEEQAAENMPASRPTEDELKKPPQDSAETPKRRGTKSSGT
jgi:hypothetical protein